MRIAWRISAMVLVLAAVGSTADNEGDELFRRVRDKVLDNSRRLPRYTCVETVLRTQYQPIRSAGNCEYLVTSRRLSADRGQLTERDRLRLDVAVVDNGEIFSWAGAGKFESHRIDEIVGSGATGSGEFGAFLHNVFAGAPDHIRYSGVADKLALFEFTVPVARSSYLFRTNGPERKIAYHGTFSADPSSSDISQLVVESEDFPQSDTVCLIRHTMNYQRVKIGSGDFLLPQVSTMEGLYRSGTTALNETHYSFCREYVGESTISFDDANPAAGPAVSGTPLAPLPAKTRLAIGLSKPIDTATAAAGDRVEGLVLQDVRSNASGSKSDIVAKANDRVHGRIVRLAQHMEAPPLWYVAIRFDTIERNGVEQPVSLRPLDDGARNAPRVRQKTAAGVVDKPDGAGLFIFSGAGDIVLDGAFHSEWETR